MFSAFGSFYIEKFVDTVAADIVWIYQGTQIILWVTSSRKLCEI